MLRIVLHGIPGFTILHIGELGDLSEFRFVEIVGEENIEPVSRHAGIATFNIRVRPVRRKDYTRFVRECYESGIKIGILIVRHLFYFVLVVIVNKNIRLSVLYGAQ